MSRDFIASAPGREFKKSPNRDRIVRLGAAYPASIVLRAGYSVFRPMQFSADYTGEHYRQATVFREVLAGPATGATMTERATFDLTSNRLTVETLQRSDNYVNLPGGLTLTYPSTTVSRLQSSTMRHTTTLDGPLFTWKSLVDATRLIFATLQDFPTGLRADTAAVYDWSYITGFPLARGVSAREQLLYDALPYFFGRSNLGFTVAWQGGPAQHSNIPGTVILSKMKPGVAPQTKWVVRELNPGNHSPSNAVRYFDRELSCERNPERQTVWEPDWSQIDENTTGRGMVKSFLFGPERWLYEISFSGVTLAAGPGSRAAFGYTAKPTCHLDIA